MTDALIISALTKIAHVDWTFYALAGLAEQARDVAGLDDDEIEAMRQARPPAL